MNFEFDELYKAARGKAPWLKKVEFMSGPAAMPTTAAWTTDTQAPAADLVISAACPIFNQSGNRLRVQVRIPWHLNLEEASDKLAIDVTKLAMDQCIASAVPLPKGWNDPTELEEIEPELSPEVPTEELEPAPMPAVEPEPEPERELVGAAAIGEALVAAGVTGKKHKK